MSVIKTIVCTCELVISLSLVINKQDCWVYMCSEGLSFVVILQVDWYSLHFLVFIGIRIELQKWTRLLSLGQQHFKNWEYIVGWISLWQGISLLTHTWSFWDCATCAAFPNKNCRNIIVFFVAHACSIAVYCFLPRLFVQKQKGLGVGHWGTMAIDLTRSGIYVVIF
jgi:hypothetical protein